MILNNLKIFWYQNFMKITCTLMILNNNRYFFFRWYKQQFGQWHVYCKKTTSDLDLSKNKIIKLTINYIFKTFFVFLFIFLDFNERIFETVISRKRKKGKKRDEVEFRVIDLSSNKKPEMPSSLTLLRNEQNKIKISKAMDLQSLLAYIPPIYHAFYGSIIKNAEQGEEKLKRPRGRPQKKSSFQKKKIARVFWWERWLMWLWIKCIHKNTLWII